MTALQGERLPKTIGQPSIPPKVRRTDHSINTGREASMTTRRGFLKHAAAAGMTFCGCGLLDAARARAPARLPVTVNGKRIKTIDVHAHVLFHKSLDLIGNEASIARPQTKGGEDMFIAVEQRLKTM